MVGGIIVAAALFVFSLFRVIDIRHEVNVLTNEYHVLRNEGRVLRDTQRNLQIEYHTKIDYRNIRAAAKRLGMREPSLQDETLHYLPVQDK